MTLAQQRVVAWHERTFENQDRAGLDMSPRRRSAGRDDAPFTTAVDKDDSDSDDGGGDGDYGDGDHGDECLS
ncbi:hypothetical protein ESCO_002412 [Escovopsis weberi]|uniref:Uncharacterized protein n=1 Tax=Escovopsis weberi TaxID=150374 RepID=A0A0M8MQX8_ESCWE|nr:hypothetical protein ESCO_002412 [Escovopsis weberi]